MTLPMSAAAVLVIAASGLSVQPTRAQSTAQAKADACLGRPGATTPKGSHWYYRIDRANGRRCWYLGPANMRVVRERAAATERSAVPIPMPAPAELRPDEQAPAAETPATAAVDTRAADANAAPAGPVTATQFSAGWPAAPDATHSNGSDTAADGGGADDVAPAQAQQPEMPAVWPALAPADRAAAAQPSDGAPGLVHLAIFLAATVAFVAIAVRAVLKLTSAWRGRGAPLAVSRPLPAARPRPAGPVIRPRRPEQQAPEPSFEAMAEPTIARLREIAKRWEQPTRIPRQPRLAAYEVEPDYTVEGPALRRQRVA
jgi:hypothetical protein